MLKSTQKIIASAFPLSLMLAVLPAHAATLTVTSISDAMNPGGGACTLRGAIAAINLGANAFGCTGSGYGTSDSVIFANALAGQTVQFASEIQIYKAVSIQGPVVAQSDPVQRVTLKGGGSFRLLYMVSGSTPLGVQDLNFTNASVAGDGGAIFSSSAVTVTRAAFNNNSASGSGGGILVYNNITISDSTFSGNTATKEGGGLWSSMSATISNSVFNNNTAYDTTLGGGAMQVTDVANITGSTFDGNRATKFGGAVYSNKPNISGSHFNNNSAESGGAIQSYISASVANCTFTNNTATDKGGAAWFGLASMADNIFEGNSAKNGGAVYSDNATIATSTFRSNSATQAGGAVGINTSAGISNSFFSDNSADRGGAVGGSTVGAVANISASTFSGNSATVEGGAVAIDNARISASTFSANSANSQGGALSLKTFIARHLTLADNISPSGAAIYLIGGAGDLANSLIIGSNTNALCAGTGTYSGSYNLGWRPASLGGGINDTSCGAANAINASTYGRYNIVTTTLANNGGLTPTLALILSSPAVGQADRAIGGTSQMLDATLTNWVDATIDQRGLSRKALVAGRDIGAVEAIVAPLPPAPNGDVLTDNYTHADALPFGDSKDNLQTVSGVFVTPFKDRGKAGSVFVFALLPESVGAAPNTVWFLDSSTNWHLYSDCRGMPSVYVGELGVIDSIPVVPLPTNLASFAGSELYIGYGLGGYNAPSGSACNDMFARKNWVKVYTVSAVVE